MIIREAGFLMLGSRLKRLGERALSEVRSVYHASEVPFETTWFPVFYVLSTHGPCSIKEMSSLLGVSHSAVSQLVTQLERRELITLRVSDADLRRKDIHLTTDGEVLMTQVGPIWRALEQSFSEHMDPSVLDILDLMEQRFDEGSIAATAIEIMHGEEHSRIELCTPEDSHIASFIVANKLSIPAEAQCYAAYQDNELVGLLGASSEGEITEVCEVFVQIMYRRRGHAFALLSKLLHNYPEKPIRIQRMNAEVLQLLAKLNHPFIVHPSNQPHE